MFDFLHIKLLMAYRLHIIILSIFRLFSCQHSGYNILPAFTLSCQHSHYYPASTLQIIVLPAFKLSCQIIVLPSFRFKSCQHSDHHPAAFTVIIILRAFRLSISSCSIHIIVLPAFTLLSCQRSGSCPAGSEILYCPATKAALNNDLAANTEQSLWVRFSSAQSNTVTL